MKLSNSLTDHSPILEPSASDDLPISAAGYDVPIGAGSFGELESYPPESTFVEGEERKQDDIKTVYHPHSRLGSHIQRFQTYGTNKNDLHEDPSIPTEPWKPFRSRLDFEVAEPPDAVMHLQI